MPTTSNNPVAIGSLVRVDGPDWDEQLATRIAQAPLSELPHLVGQLRELETRAQARLFTEARAIDAASRSEQLLDIAEAARRLHTTEDYLYHNWKKLPFAHKYSWGLRFSAAGIDEFIQRGGMSVHPPLRPKTRMRY